MNSAVHIHRVELPKPVRGITFGRRVRTIWEIEDFEVYREVANWEIKNDTFNTHFEDSYHLRQVAINSGMVFEDVVKELDNRESYLKEIIESQVRDQKEVAEKILSYKSKRRIGKSVESSSTVVPQPSVSD